MTRRKRERDGIGERGKGQGGAWEDIVWEDGSLENCEVKEKKPVVGGKQRES